MGDNRPPVYIEGDNLIIRASAIGHPCLWELIAAGQGEPMAPVPNVLRRAFDEGNLLEPVIIRRLERDYGFRFESHQSEGELWLGKGVAVRYHSDGVARVQTDAWHLSDRMVVEVKALSDALWQIARRHTVGGVMDEYNWQLSVMMEGEGLPGLWVAYNKGLPPDENGNRPDCPDAGKLLIQTVTDTPVSMTEIQLKASLIMEGVYGEPIISSDRECDTPDHWPCRYLSIRPEPEGGSPRREVLIPSDEEKAEFDRLVTEYKTFKGQYDEAKQRYEAARDGITRMAGTAGFIQTDKFYIPVYQGTAGGNIAWSEVPKELLDKLEAYRKPKRKGTKYLMSKTIKRLD